MPRKKKEVRLLEARGPGQEALTDARALLELEQALVKDPPQWICRELNGARRRRAVDGPLSEGSRKFLARLEKLHKALGEHVHTEET